MLRGAFTILILDDIWKCTYCLFFSFCRLSLIFLSSFFLISPTQHTLLFFLPSMSPPSPDDSRTPALAHTWPTLTWNTRCAEVEEEEKMKRPDALLVLIQYKWDSVKRKCDFIRLIPHRLQICYERHDLLHILKKRTCRQWHIVRWNIRKQQNLKKKKRSILKERQHEIWEERLV